MGFPQTRHFSVTRCWGCLGQKRVSCTSGVAVAAAAPAPWLNRTAGPLIGTGGGCGTVGAGGASGLAGTGGATAIRGGGAGAGAGVAGALSLSDTRIGGGAGVGAGSGAAPGELMRIIGRTGGAAGGIATPGGGRAISGAGACPAWGGTLMVVSTDNPTGPVVVPNSWHTSACNRAERSAPHDGQANGIGLRTISGDASNAYFAPQSHWIFIGSQGFGFNNTMFVGTGSGMGLDQDVVRVLPSQNRKLPPYL